MSWLTNFVRPKIQAIVGKKEIPDNLWITCPHCEKMLFKKELEANLEVCHYCNYHMRLSAHMRLKMLFDEGKYTQIPTPSVATDPLKFKDTKKYSDRLKEARQKTGNEDAILIGQGQIGGTLTLMVAFDFPFMGGSMGMAVGESLLVAADLAVKHKAPLIVIPSSGGARMQEGILSLMQMPRTTIAVQKVREAGLPYIVMLADPTTGGVSASFAMLGDITLAEPGAIIGFAGARVIKETMLKDLPDNFQKAEYLRDHGMIDIVVKRTDLKQTLAKILTLIHKPY